MCVCVCRHHKKDNQQLQTGWQIGHIKMEIETNPNDNESEVVESCVSINENGCDETHDVDTAIETGVKDGADQTVEETTTADLDKNSKKDDDVDDNDENEREEVCLSPKQSTPVDEPEPIPEPEPEPGAELESSETDQVIDSDNPSESSPDKELSGACVISSPSEVESEEQVNEKSWNQMNDSSPEKSLSEAACVISSPSEAECDDSVNEKGWNQLNESLGDEDSMDAADSDDDNEFIDRSSPKVEEKPAADCQVFELTDDNSSIEARSEGDDDMEDEELGEEEEEDNESGKMKITFYLKKKLSINCRHLFIHWILITNCFVSFLCSILDYSEVHNIDDSDDEPYIEERRNVQHQQIPSSSSSHSAKNDIKLPAKPRYDSEQMLDEDAKYTDKCASIRLGSQCRNYLKNELQKHSASKLHRYLAVKRSIKWYVFQFVIYFLNRTKYDVCSCVYTEFRGIR